MLSRSCCFSYYRSLFDLVADHPYLALTDPKLLSWYLSLSPEDRKIIQGMSQRACEIIR